jgi:tetratricopeptide (TPR) repeat protein
MLAAPHAGDRAQYASHLSAVLVSRFQFHGRTADLTAAVEAARDAMAATEADDPARPSREANLSAVLHTRFEHLGELSDLEAALRSARRALDMAPKGPRRAIYLSTVGAVLLGRYDHVDDPADLDEAIAVFRAAIDHTPANAPDLAGRWTNLGNAMLKRAATTDPSEADPPDLGPAIEACRNAVSAIRPGSPEYGAIHANLAGVLIEAYLHHPDPALLPEAADHARTAVRATPPGTPETALFLTHLGIALAELGATTGNDDLTTALSCLDEAARVSTAVPIIRMHAARWHGHYAALAGRGAEAQAGYAAAVGLLDRASWRGLARRSRERHLASVQGLASGAGAWSLHNGQPERAVELLEQGRSVLWTQLLDSPGNNSELSRVAPDLAARLAEIGRALNHALDLGTTALPLGQWP